MLEATHRGAPRRIFSPAGLLITGFIFLSGVGGLLLALPIANNQGGTPLDLAYFTAISAVTVTGHTVVNTSTYWSPFGQVIIFLLMLVGGLGFMVLATFLLILLVNTTWRSLDPAGTAVGVGPFVPVVDRANRVIFRV